MSLAWGPARDAASCGGLVPVAVDPEAFTFTTFENAARYDELVLVAISRSSRCAPTFCFHSPGTLTSPTCPGTGSPAFRSGARREALRQVASGVGTSHQASSGPHPERAGAKGRCRDRGGTRMHEHPRSAGDRNADRHVNVVRGYCARTSPRARSSFRSRALAVLNRIGDLYETGLSITPSRALAKKEGR